MTLGLAGVDVCGEVCAGVGVGVAVTREVQLRLLPRAEGDVDQGIVAGVGEGALVAVLAPVDGNAAAMAPG
jgi:hypothetical protein